MSKICIPESNSPSEEESQWLTEILEQYQEEIDILEIRELTIIRFFRAYVNDPDPKEKAFLAIKDFIQWRLDEHVDDIAATDFPRRSEFLTEWPHGPHGISKDGHIVYIDRPGQFNPKTLSTNFSMDEYIQMHIQTMEWMDYLKHQMSERIGIQTYKHIVVLDLDNIGLKHVSGDFTNPLKQIINIDTTKYPETLHKMFIVNAPFIFKVIWTMYSPFLDDVTKGRIHMSKVKDLLEYIDPNQLPNCLNGLVQYTKENPPFVRSFRTIRPQHGKRRLSISKTITKTTTTTAEDGSHVTTTTTSHAEATTTMEVQVDTTTTTTTFIAEKTVTVEDDHQVKTKTKTAEASISVTSPTGSAPELEEAASVPPLTQVSSSSSTPSTDATASSPQPSDAAASPVVVAPPTVNTPPIQYVVNEHGHFVNDGRYDDLFSFETFLAYQRAKAERVRERRIPYDERKKAEADAKAAAAAAGQCGEDGKETSQSKSKSASK